MNANDLSLVPARAALGATMLYHGAGKLRGRGIRQHGDAFEQMGFRPGPAWAALTGAAEVIAGATTVLGIGTRLGALAVLVTQGVAVAKVHGGKGFSNLGGGYEFNLALMAIALGLLASGPGPVSAREAFLRRGRRRGLLGRARRGLLARAFGGRPAPRFRAAELLA
jgi:putative oxidoreductase